MYRLPCNLPSVNRLQTMSGDLTQNDTFANGANMMMPSWVAIAGINAAYKGTVTAFGLVALFITILGMISTIGRVDRASHMTGLAQQTYEWEDVHALDRYRNRQLVVLVGSIPRIIVVIALIVAQWSPIPTSAKHLLSVRNRTNVGCCLLALLAVDVVRVWFYRAEPWRVLQSSTAATIRHGVVKCMRWVAPIIAATAVLWNIVDLASEVLYARECAWFCADWFLWLINGSAVLVTIGGWLHAAEELFSFYMHHPDRPSKEGAETWTSGCTTCICAVFLALFACADYGYLIAFRFLPHVPPDSEFSGPPSIIPDRSDIAWYLFVIFYMVYLSLDAVVLIMGRIDQPPISMGAFPADNVDGEPALALRSALDSLAKSSTRPVESDSTNDESHHAPVTPRPAIRHAEVSETRVAGDVTLAVPATAQ